MIHPKTKIQFISEEVGYGVFATENIPCGTIVYVKDSLELVITPTEYLLQSPDMKKMVDRYSYRDENGNRIVSWDFAKYVNHCCNCNSISTGYGFEIAIRDIEPGEQITDEYGIFNLDEEMNLSCGQDCCRKTIKPDDFDRYYKQWDQKIQLALPKLFEVDQPLMPLLDPATREELDAYFINSDSYKSVYALRLKNGSKVPLPGMGIIKS
ncbi:SET domain-containing protein [Luteibaculum oceani]|uniref:SET domain-containing protein n=1 Tax=Luteibaculum oceani TaxID=1294296 RepID=A0A5C6UW90_9FLAO|nr:SET domain-containing protein [Luteibaculum oceani]TXC75238.1 SET domain-containing protein [Luteibaculum oceani]